MSIAIETSTEFRLIPLRITATTRAAIMQQIRAAVQTELEENYTVGERFEFTVKEMDGSVRELMTADGEWDGERALLTFDIGEPCQCGCDTAFFNGTRK